MMSRILIALGVALTLGLATLITLDRMGIPVTPHDRAVVELVSRNVEARGGAEAWSNVSSMRMSGQIDLGQGMHVPYVLEQKRPGKMCLEFVFEEETAIQCADGKTGWKVTPFRGRTFPEPMTDRELRETADSTDPYGLLIDFAARGHEVELLGQEAVKGRVTYKLQVTLPGGAIRWLYLDVESALEVKLEAIRMIAGNEQRIETFFYDWQPVDGLLIARRQESRPVGAEDTNFLTVEEVSVNPPLDDARFAMPARAGAGRGSSSSDLKRVES